MLDQSIQITYITIWIKETGEISAWKLYINVKQASKAED